MDSAKTKERLEKERAEIIEAGNLAQKELAGAKAHVEKLNICIIQLQGQKAVYDKLLGDESFFEEKTGNAATRS